LQAEDDFGDDAKLVLFRKFSDRLASQDAQDTLVLIIEASVIMLGIMIMVYLKGKSTSMKL
jgi:hypothetical protein